MRQGEKAERFRSLHERNAEAMRDQGDFSSLAGSARIKEWLGS